MAAALTRGHGPIDYVDLELVTGGGLFGELGSTLGTLAGQWLGKALGGLFGEQGAAIGEQIGAVGGRALGGTAGAMLEQPQESQQA